MNKFSLFDFLIFLLPGGIALQLLFWLSLRIGINIETDRPIILDSEVMAAFVAFVAAYLLGVIINQVRLSFSWLSAKSKDSYLNPLKKNSDWWQVLDRACKKFYAKELVIEGAVEGKSADVFFDLSFDLLDQEEKLSRAQALRMQAFFLENCMSVFFISGGIWSILTLVSLMGWISPSKQMAPGIEIILAGLLMILGFGFRWIASKRWLIFYYTIWRNFYVFYRYNELTNKEYNDQDN